MISSKNTLAITKYMEELRGFAHFEHTKLMNLFREMIIADKHNQQKIKNTIISHNLRLVVSIAKKYKSHKIPLEDLIQEGNLGLIKAIEKFDPEKGFAFSTYAQWWIRQAISQFILKNKKMIRLPAHAASIQNKMIQKVEDYRKEFGCSPTTEELIAVMDESETVIRATLQANKSIVSLHAPARLYGFSNAPSQTPLLIDNIPEIYQENNPFEKIAKNQLLKIVNDIFLSLTDKENAIIRMRCGISEDECDDEKYPITQEELTQIQSGQGLS